MRPAKIQIRLRFRAVWSESSLGAFRMQSFFMRTTETLVRLRGCTGRFELRWAHMSDGTSSHATNHLCRVTQKYKLGERICEQQRPRSTSASTIVWSGHLQFITRKHWHHRIYGWRPTNPGHLAQADHGLRCSHTPLCAFLQGSSFISRQEDWDWYEFTQLSQSKHSLPWREANSTTRITLTSERESEKIYIWHGHPTKTQISLRIRAVWFESSLSAWRNFASLAIQNALTEDSRQTARMCKLIWIFARCTYPK